MTDPGDSLDREFARLRRAVIERVLEHQGLELNSVGRSRLDVARDYRDWEISQIPSELLEARTFWGRAAVMVARITRLRGVGRVLRLLRSRESR